ncbi:hypothetical protein C6P45_001633 [Maudiozyma exigua]|uniref:Serine aminopeptidase S33 domain-containing protein n=1 Tax=Maudiozyma exigua TaxID=34358 RepID=A0A9P7BAY2_MAUEX|nr:hypothetical protein C6P45_001633 [Kazachstania exigua]
MDYNKADRANVKLRDNELFIYVLDPTSETYDKEVKLATIITPPSFETTEISKNMKVALLLHGHQSHKNAIYQPLMARALSDKGYAVVRFDFRGQGDSSPNSSKQEGRTIEQDVDDLDMMMNFVRNGSLKQIINESLLEKMQSAKVETYETVDIDMIIAHSRGVLVMFQYILQKPDLPIRLLVNCCGRYDGNGLLCRYTNMVPTWLDDGGLEISTLRHGKYSKSWIPTPEILSAASVKTSKFKAINNAERVIHVYGTCDTVIPMEDARKYVDTFGSLSSLLVLEGSDHNFYGLKDDLNAHKLPLRNGIVNYSVLFVSEYLKMLTQFENKTVSAK